MKKLILLSILFCLSLTVPAGLFAATPNTPVPAGAAAPDTAGVSKMLHRLDQIQHMDKSNLSASDKKALRKEVKSIRTKLKEIGGGFYISGGALIIIIILLIILL